MKKINVSYIQLALSNFDINILKELELDYIKLTDANYTIDFVLDDQYYPKPREHDNVIYYVKLYYNACGGTWTMTIKHKDYPYGLIDFEILYGILNMLGVV